MAINPFTYGALTYDITVFSKSTSTSSSGAVTAAWTTTRAYLTDVDVQPVSSEILRQLEGSRESIKYQCIVAGRPDIHEGDRVYDPLSSRTTGGPDMEIFSVKQFWLYSDIPAHTEFLLRRVTGVATE